MTLPRCIRCNRPIQPGEASHSRRGATRPVYWHAADCLGEMVTTPAPAQMVPYDGVAIRAASGRRTAPAAGSDRGGRRRRP